MEILEGIIKMLLGYLLLVYIFAFMLFLSLVGGVILLTKLILLCGI